MNQEPTLFDGFAARDEGERRVVGSSDDAAGAAYKERFSAAFDRVAQSGERFTADDILKVVGEPPLRPDGRARPNLVGALFGSKVRRAMRRGAVEMVGLTHMTKVSSHARRTPVYRGGAK